jgi:hypothetical protein
VFVFLEDHDLVGLQWLDLHSIEFVSMLLTHVTSVDCGYGEEENDM